MVEIPAAQPSPKQASKPYARVGESAARVLPAAASPVITAQQQAMAQAAAMVKSASTSNQRMQARLLAAAANGIAVGTSQWSNFMAGYDQPVKPIPSSASWPRIVSQQLNNASVSVSSEALLASSQPRAANPQLLPQNGHTKALVNHTPVTGVKPQTTLCASPATQSKTQTTTHAQRPTQPQPKKPDSTPSTPTPLIIRQYVPIKPKSSIASGTDSGATGAEQKTNQAVRSKLKIAPKPTPAASTSASVLGGAMTASQLAQAGGKGKGKAVSSPEVEDLSFPEIQAPHILSNTAVASASQQEMVPRFRRDADGKIRVRWHKRSEADMGSGSGDESIFPSRQRRLDGDVVSVGVSLALPPAETQRLGNLSSSPRGASSRTSSVAEVSVDLNAGRNIPQTEGQDSGSDVPMDLDDSSDEPGQPRDMRSIGRTTCSRPGTNNVRCNSRCNKDNRCPC